MSKADKPQLDDFQSSLTFKEAHGFYPWEMERVGEADLENLQDRARREAELRGEMFSGQSDYAKEIEATQAFAQASKLVMKTYKLGTSAYSVLMMAPDRSKGGLLKWAAPDWDLVMYCALLLRYIALCGQYEMRAFTPEQRLARDVREKRRKELLEKWPIAEDYLAA